MPPRRKKATAKTRSVGRAGLPSPDTVVMELTLPSPLAAPRAAGIARPEYRILRTNQVDEYEPPVARSIVAATAAARAVVGNNFEGTARRKAKTSISRARKEEFDDVQQLLGALPNEKHMKDRKPRITNGSSSSRVKEEERNVHVRGWIYAASREDDNDFHLIIGPRPSSPPVYITVEVSGLPPPSSPYYARLKRARNAYKAFFKDHPDKLPGTTYDFYDPPIPVEIKGCLFFDIAHLNAGRPGPKDLRDDIPTVWEIHPVTHIKFEP